MQLPLTTLRCYAEAYKKIKSRGAVWRESWTVPGGWYSYYTPDAGKIFLNRFDESIQKQIKAYVGESDVLATITHNGEVISI